MRVGADDDDSMSARDKMLGRFCFIYATSCCVFWIGEEDRDKKEKGNISFNIFGRSFTAKFFSLKMIPYLTSSFAVSPSFVVQNFFRSGVVVCYYYCCCCTCMNRTGISFLCSCVYTFDNRGFSVCLSFYVCADIFMRLLYLHHRNSRYHGFPLHAVGLWRVSWTKPIFSINSISVDQY